MSGLDSRDSVTLLDVVLPALCMAAALYVAIAGILGS